MGQPSEPTWPDAGNAEQTPPEPVSKDPSQSAAAARKLSAARSGSRTAMGELFDNCRNYLLLVANASVGEGLRAKVAASDLVQETLLEAGQIFERFTGSSEEELLRWLTRILENKLGNAVKRYIGAEKRDLSREVRLVDADSGEIPVGSLDDSGDSPSAVLSAEEEGARIQAAVLQLPEDYRRVIDLRVHQALSFEDVGRAMDRTSEAARKLFVRAIDELRLRMRCDDQSAGQS
jgi:RNA polymerase sigma-70 factor, ECF subfamily